MTVEGGSDPMAPYLPVGHVPKSLMFTTALRGLPREGYGHILLKLLSPNASEAPALLALYSYGQIKGKHTLMNRKSLLSTP